MQELVTYTVEESNDALVISQHMGSLLSLGEALVKSGLAPDTIRTPEAAAAVVLKGRELGLPPMLSLSHIVIIKGKPTLSAEVMLGMMHRAGHEVWFSETSSERAVIHGIRKGSTREQSLTWTIDDAKAAGLLKNPTWTAYRPAMLRARAISAFGRFFAPDVLMGAYTPEEMGAQVNERGEFTGMNAEADEAQPARGTAGLAARLAATRAPATTPDEPDDEPVDAEFTPAPTEETGDTVLRITRPQATAIAIALKDAKFKDTPEGKTDGRRFVAWLAGIEGTLESSNDLTREQAATVLERLGDGDNGSYRTDKARLDAELAAWNDHLDLQRSAGTAAEQVPLPDFDPNARPSRKGLGAPIAADEKAPDLDDERMPF